MAKASALVLLLALAGCTGFIQPPSTASPCATQGEASYPCQIERYNRVSA